MTTEIPGRGEGLPETRRTISDLTDTRSETVIHNRGVFREKVETALDDGLKKTTEVLFSPLTSAIMDILSFDPEKRASLSLEKQAVCDWLNQYAKSMVAGAVFERRGEIIVTAPQLKNALSKLPADEIKKIEDAVEMIFPKPTPQPESL